MERPSNAEATADTLNAAREYAWNWFELHAKQRQQSFHFYIILITGVLGAYYVASRLGSHASSASAQSYSAYPLLVSCFAIVTSFLFYRLDRRNRALVKYGEAALKAFEEDFAVKLGEPLAPRIIDYAAAPYSYQSGYVPAATTYGDIYRIIFAVGALAGAIGMAVSWPPQGIGRFLNSMFV